MKTHSLRFSSALHSLVLGTTLSTLSIYHSYAAPLDGTVAGGAAQITTNGSSTLILQSTDKAAIDWRSFDVKTNESVVFQQPSSSSVTLNRIHDQKPSEIFGSVSSNGKIILSNPNGMIFGHNSRVDVAGLVATTASISTNAFMNDAVLSFGQSGNPGSTITHYGTITAKEAGLVALIAPNIENHGLIGARLGKVQLAGADTFALDFYGDGLLSIAVDRSTETSIKHTGTIRAKAGTVALTAAQAGQVVSSAINLSGVVDVSASRTDANGAVVFADGIGGGVQLSACTVDVASGATIDARGPNGGGSVHIGGGWQGEKLKLGNHVLANAGTVTMHNGAVIRANATQKGDGGKVVLWSEDATRFDGLIKAKGGKNDGNGGKIETSSKGILGITGNADASATKGLAGDWLLDPRNVRITGGGAYSVNSAGETVDPGSDDFTILDSSISTALTNGNNVTITTGTTGGQTGDITLDNATIAKTGGGPATLTLKAEGSILTSGTNTINSNTGALNVIFWSDAEAVPNSDGYINLTNTTITTNGGSVFMGGGLDNGANGGTAADGRPDNYAWGNATVDDGVTLNNTDITTAAGSILIRGHGYNSAGSDAHLGVYLSNDTDLTTTGEGAITLSGIAGNGRDYNTGVYVSGATTSISAVDGDISITGSSATTTGEYNFGVSVENGADIISTGTGASAGSITLHGTGGNGGTTGNMGVIVTHTGSTVTSVDGDITITGIAGNGNSNNHFGAYVNDSAVVSSTGNAGGAANISITGTGGVGTDDNWGVGVNSSGAVTSLVGNITIDGTAGDGTTSDNYGVTILNSSQVTATSGTIGITGRGGNGTTRNHGVFIRDNGSVVSVDTGALSLTGIGDGTGAENFGIEIGNGADVFSTGTGAAVGDITINGTAAANATGTMNIGVMIRNNGTLLTSQDADINITGTGNNSAGIRGSGVWIHDTGRVTTTSTTANAGNITITGHGLNGDEQHGVIFQAHGRAYTAKGNISVTGDAVGTGSAAGILFVNGGEVDSLDGNITLTGTKVGGSSDLAMLPYTDTNLIGSNTMVGNITMVADTIDFQAQDIRTQNNITFQPRTNNTAIGVSGGAGALQISDGVLATVSPDVDTNGTGSLIIGNSAAGTGTVDINGWDISGKTYDVEVYGGTVDFTGSGVVWNQGNSLLFNSRTGNIIIDQNFTRNAGAAGDGTLTFKASGNITTAGTRTISAATAGATGELNTIFWSDAEAAPNSNGYISLTNTTLTTNGGDVVLGGGLDPLANYAIAPDDYINGIYLSSSSVNAGGGAITMRGQSTGTIQYQHGVNFISSTVSTTGTGNISIYGYGGAGAAGVNYGTRISDSTVSLENGTAYVFGQGGAASTGNHGVAFESNGSLTSNGSASITIEGIGGAGTSAGFRTNNVGSNVIGGGSATGDITILTNNMSVTNLDARTDGSIIIKPRTEPTSIGISGGTCGGTCTLNITDTILAGLTADDDANGTGSLIIGDSTDATGTVDINGWDISGKRYDVEVYGGTVDFTGGAVTWNQDNSLLFNSRTGDIVIDQDFTRNAGTAGDGTLTLKAAGSITSSGTRSITAATAGATGKLHAILWSDAEAAPNNDGYIALTNTAITTNGGDVILGGGLDDGANGGVAADGRPDNYALGNAGADDGVTLNNGDITTAAGSIKILGHGRNNGAGSQQYGINMSGGSAFSTTGEGAIALLGTGGNGTSDNFGVYMSGNTTSMSVIDGDISITGNGATGSTTGQNTGVWIDSGADLLSDGTGISAGKITITGTGGTGTGSLMGTYIKDTGTTITSKEGKITISGNAGSGAAIGNNYGTRISNATITSVNNADIEINGTAGNLGSANRGVYIFNTDTLITTQGTGDITITGFGGDAAGTSSNHGVYIRDGAEITSTATGANAGDITINGTSGDSDNNNYGIYVSENTTKITSVDGDILFVGQGGTGTGTWNEGMYFNSGAEISSSGTGVNAGSITINATAGSGTNNQFGLDMESGAFVSSRDGDIALSGTGGSVGGGANNQGIHLNGVSITTNGDANISLTGTSTTAGSIDILQNGTASTIGTAGTTTGNITFNANTISVTDLTTRTNNNISFLPRSNATSIGISGGTCGGACTLNLTDTVLSKTFADNDADGTGTLTIGSASAGTGLVEIAGWDISGNRYDVEVYGGTVNFDTGAIRWDQDNSLLFYSRTGLINIDTSFFRDAGLAGDGTLTFKAASDITTSGTRAITTATAGATGKLHTIVWSDADNSGAGLINLADVTFVTNGGDFVAAGGLDDGADILSSDGATILHNGIAADGRPDNYATGTSGANNDGVLFDTVDITAGEGSIILRGHGFDEAVGATDYKIGLAIFDDSDLTTTTGNIILNGMGGNGNSYGRGVGIYDATTRIVTTSGAISVMGRGATTGATGLQGVLFFDGATIESTGTGGGIGAVTLDGLAGNGTGGDNHGVTFLTGANLVSADANITIKGTGGDGGSNNQGVLLSASDISVVNGDLSITGVAGDNAAGDTNTGIYISGGMGIASTGLAGAGGSITLHGTGGVGTNANNGIYMNSAGSTISSAYGDILLTGIGGNGSTTENSGIKIETDALISSTGTGAQAAKITLDGTAGGAGTNSNLGVYLIDSDITTVDGDVSVTGVGDGAGVNNHGVYMNTNSTMVSTSSTAGLGDITLHGTGADGSNANYGFYNTSGSTLTAAAGDIQITGNGGVLATSGGNFGIWINDDITTTTGGITLLGTGGGGGGAGNFNDGVYMNADLFTTDGNILITGNAGNAATGRGQIGSYIEGDITSTGSGNVTINGTGGNAGTDINYGLYFNGAANAITVNTGNIALTGTGGTGSSNNNHGIFIDNTGGLVSGGAGTIALTGTRGDINAATSDIRISGGAQTIGGAAATGAQTWTADTVSLANFTADTDGAITFRTRTLGQNINLGGAVGGLELSDANLDALVAGNLIFGQATGTGTITLDAYAWDDPVRFVTANTGAVSVAGAQTAVGASDATMRFSGPTTLSNDINISAAGGARTLAFNNAVVLGADTTLNTGAGNITFDSTLNGTHDLSVVTTGDLTFTGNVGLLNALADVSVTNVNDFSADIMHAHDFTITGGTGNITFSNNSLHATGDVDIATAGNITGTYYGINGSLFSTAGNVNATVYFDALDINGLGATLLAGRVGAAGVADQSMANRISINGVAYPTLVANAAYTFAGYIIGNTATTPSSGSGGSGSTPPVTPPTNGGGPGGSSGGSGGDNSGGGNGVGSNGGGGFIDIVLGQDYSFEAAKRMQVMDVTRGTLLFETSQFDPTFGSIEIAPAPEVSEFGLEEATDPSDFEVISTESGDARSAEGQPLSKKPLYRFLGGLRQGFVPAK